MLSISFPLMFGSSLSPLFGVDSQFKHIFQMGDKKPSLDIQTPYVRMCEGFTPIHISWGMTGGWRLDAYHGNPQPSFFKGYWVVVSNIFNFHPYLGKWSNLTNIFQKGWNHQPAYFEEGGPSWEGSKENKKPQQATGTINHWFPLIRPY